MQNTNQILSLWRRTALKPGGKKLFSRLVCLYEPYAASIRPTVEVLESGHVEVSMRKRRAVTDHNGQIHDMAMCNLAALAARLLAETSIPDSCYWRPKGFTATHGALVTPWIIAITNTRLQITKQAPTKHQIAVEVRDFNSELACRAQLEIQVAPR